MAVASDSPGPFKALSLQQGHTVSCKTSRDASHNDGIIFYNKKVTATNL